VGLSLEKFDFDIFAGAERTVVIVVVAVAMVRANHD
jgi:hypothetical protein